MASKAIRACLRKSLINSVSLPSHSKGFRCLPSISKSYFSTTSTCLNATLSLAHPPVQKLLHRLHDESAGSTKTELDRVVGTIIEKQTEVTELLAMGKENPDLKDVAEADAVKVQNALAELEKQFFSLVVEPDKMDYCTEVILEISAGVGGQEAMLFTSELLNMYSNYALRKGWECEVAGQDATEIGGIRHAVLQVTGPFVYKTLKFEGGVHRVQRVPKTEKSGRIHTSAASIAIMPMPEDVDIEINQQDLKIEAKRASGPGGMNVNKSESAVRVTHLPTGIAVECQTQRTQMQNRASALKTLRAKLYQLEIDKQTAQISRTRKLQVGSGGRNEKIRTYNFVQDRVTDHRIGFTTHNLEEILDGGEPLDEMINELHNFDKNEKLGELFK